MILWEMATMTKPFEMMGREQFLKEVVSCSVLSLIGPRLGMNKPPAVCSMPLSLSSVVFCAPHTRESGSSSQILFEKH